MSEVKGKVLFNVILIELEKISSTIETDMLRSYQKVVAKGQHVNEIEIGDYVEVNYNNYFKPVVRKQQMSPDKKDMELQLPTLEINGKVYGKITERDVDYVYHKSELPKDSKSIEVKA